MWYFVYECVFSCLHALTTERETRVRCTKTRIAGFTVSEIREEISHPSKRGLRLATAYFNTILWCSVCHIRGEGCAFMGGITTGVETAMKL